MKAEEAKAKSIKTREQTVLSQLEEVHKEIENTTSKGGFSLIMGNHSYSSSRYLGWLVEVVKTLKEEGYTVYFSPNGHLEIAWGPCNKVASVEPRPSAEPHIHKIGSWWKVW